MSLQTFKVGDVIRWRGRDSRRFSSRTAYGTLARLGELSAAVKPEDGSRAVVFRRRTRNHNWDFYYVSPFDYARLLWERKKPICTALTASMYFDRGLEVHCNINRDLGKFDQAIEELRLLAAWLSEEPKKP
jgi:hypothetical protein